MNEFIIDFFKDDRYTCTSSASVTPQTSKMTVQSSVPKNNNKEVSVTYLDLQNFNCLLME